MRKDNMKNILWKIILFGVGIFLIVEGVKERSLASAASAAPEEISLTALIARGPDSNPNIILTDYALGDDIIVKSRSGSWTGAWVPAIPGKPGPERPHKPQVLQAVIYSSQARNAEELYQRCEQTKLRALLVNKIQSLEPDERGLLERSYPGTDFSKCLIIHEGREPAGTGKVLLMVGGGILLSLAALVWFVAGLASSARAKSDPAPEGHIDSRA